MYRMKFGTNDADQSASTPLLLCGTTLSQVVSGTPTFKACHVHLNRETLTRSSMYHASQSFVCSSCWRTLWCMSVPAKFFREFCSPWSNESSSSMFSGLGRADAESARWFGETSVPCDSCDSSFDSFDSFYASCLFGPFCPCGASCLFGPFGPFGDVCGLCGLCERLSSGISCLESKPPKFV